MGALATARAYRRRLFLRMSGKEVVTSHICPPYNPDHLYVFQIDVPERPLTFAVGDAGTGDNSGEYQIVVRDLPH